VTEWNSSALVKAATRTGKKKNLADADDLQPAARDRLRRSAALQDRAAAQGRHAVLADRYAYTAFARDVARGVHRQWVRELYSFAVRPDLALYFRVPIEVSIERLMARRVKLKFYEAGLDMGWTTGVVESFRLFQSKVLDEYEPLVDEYGLQVVDASRSITDQQQLVRRILAEVTWRTAMPHEPAPPTEPGRARSPATTTATGWPTCRSDQYPGRSSPSKGPTAWGARRRCTCCASGSRCAATG
jgi:dTMP kinase